MPPQPPLPESRSRGCRHSSNYRRVSHPRRFPHCPHPVPCGRGKRYCGCAGQCSAARPQIRFRPCIRFGRRTRKRPLYVSCLNCYRSHRSDAHVGTPQDWQRNRLRPSYGRTAARFGYNVLHISETPSPAPVRTSAGSTAAFAELPACSPETAPGRSGQCHCG
jgi:hypothetical protein